MRVQTRGFVALLLCELLIALPLEAAPRVEADLDAVVFDDLQHALQKPYMELFELAAGLEFSSPQIAKMRRYLEETERQCVKGFKRQAKDLRSKLRDAQQELRKRSDRLNDTQRHELHCRIQNLRIMQAEAAMLAEHAVPVAYANEQAKLDLIEKWPAEIQRIRQEMDSGAYLNRRYGDTKDIGFREIAPGQEKDVKRGEEAVERMKQMGLLPKELDSEPVQEYVRELGRNIAAKSDLRVPLQLAVLDTAEVNAFALPGGYLYVHRGLLEKAEDEAQLAGVLAHEMAHAAARHSHKLMKKATIASILYQAAQISAMILTGGVVGIGAYYALQYGFYGLGLVINLKLLGVSREYELEADQLGVQYAWNAGYDPRGFIRFFDKMATTEGYVRGASWFRTHPPFYERMVDAQREIHFLGEKEQFILQTPQFEKMQQDLAKACADDEKLEACRPSLLAPVQKDCPPPEKIEYEPGQPIDTLCSPPRMARSQP